MAELNREQIKEIIPHRDPFLFLDEVVELVPGEKVVALKAVKLEEPHFKGHFPGQPIMPGVLIVEALAQAGAVAALSAPGNEGKLVLFAGKADARALVDGKLACKAELTFAIAERES